MKATLMVLMLWACATQVHAQSDADENAASLVVQQFFDAMAARDTAALRQTMLPGARLLNPIRRNGALTLRVTEIERLGEMVMATPQPYLERMRAREVRVHGDLATVWGRYTFRVGETITNCGMNSFQLIRIPEGWKISAMASTIEVADCESW